MQLHEKILGACAIYQMLIGLLLFCFMLSSFVQPESLLRTVFDLTEDQVRISDLDLNTWQQTAVAFGMHAYADLANGYELYAIVFSAYRGRKDPPLAPVMTVWNTTMFIIRIIWLLTIINGLVSIHRKNFWYILYSSGISLKLLLSILAFDAMVVRPAAVYCQRIYNDEHVPPPNQEHCAWKKLSILQKICKCIFFYEAIITGWSGSMYFIFPGLFANLYFPSLDPSQLTTWCFTQFGVNVFTFGLYQMSADIDTRVGHVAWWLLLDFVWMYYYWVGVDKIYGNFNPFFLSGANFWCHAAFHSDSTLAVARIIYLHCFLTQSQIYVGVKKSRGTQKSEALVDTLVQDLTSAHRRNRSTGMKANNR